MWLSPQGFTVDWMNQFYDLMAKQPAWLTGLVFGPQVRDPLPTLRAKIDPRYKIRLYPDITHSLRAQYPVPDWDLAHAQTSNREPINPRPLDQTAIYRALDGHAIGFITYSEGCNDDVNKIVWSALGWDRDAEPAETLRQYSRYFIGDGFADSVRDRPAGARAELARPADWPTPAWTPRCASSRSLERAAAPRDLLNWRFQQALYRAYYDAYVRQRLLAERARESEAMGHLASARGIGAARAVDLAAASLAQPSLTPALVALRARIGELAEALFQSIRMQLAVKPYGAIGVGRGATLDTIDMPLNDRAWLSERFTEIRALASEDERLAAIDRHPDVDRSGARRFLRRPRRPGAPAAPGPRRGPGCRSRLVSVGGRGLRLSRRVAVVVDDARRVVLRRQGRDALRRARPRREVPRRRRLRRRRLQLHAQAAPRRRWHDGSARLDQQGRPPEARRVRHPRIGHRRWRADADVAAGARRRRRRARQPDC